MTLQQSIKEMMQTQFVFSTDIIQLHFTNNTVKNYKVSEMGLMKEDGYFIKQSTKFRKSKDSTYKTNIWIFEIL